jgi:hypothetical protein
VLSVVFLAGGTAKQGSPGAEGPAPDVIEAGAPGHGAAAALVAPVISGRCTSLPAGACVASCRIYADKQAKIEIVLSL